MGKKSRTFRISKDLAEEIKKIQDKNETTFTDASKILAKAYKQIKPKKFSIDYEF